MSINFYSIRSFSLQAESVGRVRLSPATWWNITWWMPTRPSLGWGFAGLVASLVVNNIGWKGKAIQSDTNWMLEPANEFPLFSLQQTTSNVAEEKRLRQSKQRSTFGTGLPISRAQFFSAQNLTQNRVRPATMWPTTITKHVPFSKYLQRAIGWSLVKS